LVRMELRSEAGPGRSTALRAGLCQMASDKTMGVVGEVLKMLLSDSARGRHVAPAVCVEVESMIAERFRSCGCRTSMGRKRWEPLRRHHTFGEGMIALALDRSVRRATRAEKAHIHLLPFLREMNWRRLRIAVVGMFVDGQREEVGVDVAGLDGDGRSVQRLSRVELANRRCKTWM
jgi:hypothetical protein